jgi:rhodanese-related sulfurtransferase
LSELRALLDAARARIDRYTPAEARRAVAHGAVLVDIRPLHDIGIARAGDLAGGVEAWGAAGLPMAR